MSEYRYGFIGVGNIASAMAESFIGNGVAEPENIMMYDIAPERVDKFEARGVRRATGSREVCERCGFVIIAVQPYQMKECLAGLRGAAIEDGTVIVSIAASVPTVFVTRELGIDIGVIRLMPNIPMLIGKGAVAATRNKFVPDASFEAFVEDLRRISVVSVMDEGHMNAVVSVNGSAPAYVYLLVRSMLEGAESLGISREVSEPLILQTIEGAVGMIRREHVPIEALIDRVCTPGGTTLAAMSSFDNSDFSFVIADAMRACTKRADEMTAALGQS